MIWRTHMCGEPQKELVGERLTLSGWAARRRDHGGLVFVDLRDRSGITQLVVNPELAPEAAELAHQIRNEFVLRAEGTLVARSAETVNPSMATGEVELQVESLEIVSRSTALPFQLDEENVDETLRLRYRWLDLRGDPAHPEAPPAALHRVAEGSLGRFDLGEQVGEGVQRPGAGLLLGSGIGGDTRLVQDVLVEPERDRVAVVG